MQKKLFLLLLTIYCGIGSSIAQNLTSDLWQDVPQARLDSEADRRIIPERFRSVRLDFPQLKNQTTNVPHEDRVAVKNSSFTIDIPTPDASFSTFRIVEYSMMEPELAARYPQIRTFYGYNVKSPSESIRMDMTDRGFHATYQSTGGKVYIDPYAFGDVEHYMVYYKKDYEAPDKLWECAVESHAIDTETHTGDQQLLRAGDCNFRTYRLALATTLEYSGYHGASSQAQSNLVMSAVTTTMNRVNGIFERDFAIRMLLVNNNDRIFFYQSTGDSYTNQDGGAMLGQNQTVCDNTIGSANYDIGHVFSTGGGGVAYLDSPCNNNRKAGGVTGQNAPVGDPFDVDYVAHEMGHQFGANHTQNNNCQRNGGTAMEPGSASTIMGYAGICNPNVQNNSDDHFHAVSVSEVMANVVSGVSSTCDVQTSMPNNAPTVSAGANYTIPRGTSFVLTATGSDSDGDPLTYCWEQYDNEVVAHPPQSSYTNGPAFRSFSPTTSPSRYFPNLNAIIANSSPTWEVLSDVSRTYDFRVTVRDNSTNQAGCTAEDDMRVTVTDNSGPLLVTSPNAGNEVWTETATETVTWNVANTDQAPVNATTVDILISYDGGLTYTTTLASNVPNTGTAEVQVPIGTSNTVRIMVIGHNNIFFDISNENFVIEQGAPNYLLTSDAPNQAACQGQTATYTIDVEQFLGYTDPVTLTLNNVPSGATSVISPNPVTPGNSATITVSNLGSVSPGDYSMQLVGTSTVGERTLDLGLSVQLPVTNAPTLVSPANNSNNVSLLPTLDWNAVAQVAQYEVQISTTPTFTNVVAMATVSTANWVSTVGLSTQTEYYWRVRGVNSGCGAGPFSAVRQFRTGNCGDFVSTETITISASGTPLIVSSITVPAINITEVTLPNIRGTHTWSADLDISIRSPQGTSVSLMEDLCGDNNDFNIGFSDSSPNAYANITCNPTGNGLVYRPLGTLADFNGESSEGDWVLNIRDDAPQDGGQLQTWSITVCGSSVAPALSVTWLNIATTASATAIAVEWEVTNELDVEEYIVERRAESETDFKAIGTVAGTNKNSEAVVKYSFTDDNAELGQTYYYRVRQVEYSGQASLSPIRYAAIQGVVAQQLIAFPNPVSDRVYIEMTNTNRGKVELELLDTTGKVVRRIETRTNRVEWDVTQLPTGLYYLKSNGAIQAVTKVVIR